MYLIVGLLKPLVLHVPYPFPKIINENVFLSMVYYVSYYTETLTLFMEEYISGLLADEIISPHLPATSR